MVTRSGSRRLPQDGAGRGYSAGAIALSGHSSTQVAQSLHFSASITYAPSPSEMASSGHTSAHAPQEMHTSASIT